MIFFTEHLEKSEQKTMRVNLWMVCGNPARAEKVNAPHCSVFPANFPSSPEQTVEPPAEPVELPSSPVKSCASRQEGETAKSQPAQLTSLFKVMQLTE